MSRVTKKKHISPWGCAPKISLRVAPNCGQTIYCLEQDLSWCSKVSVSFLPTRKSSRLQCNEFHSLSRMAYDFWSWKWMIQSTWTRISLRENLQWRLMGLFNACDKFLLLRASQPKKRICCRHDHHQLLETSCLILLFFQQKNAGEIWISRISQQKPGSLNIFAWRCDHGSCCRQPSQTQQTGSSLIAYSFFLIQILPSKHTLETSELETYAKQMDVFFVFL